MYRIFDLCLASNTQLPELPSYPGSPDIQFIMVVQPPNTQEENVEWLRHWHTPDGQLFTSCGVLPNSDIVLNFPDMAEFYISADQREIRCFSAPDIPEKTIRHLLLDQVIPRILGHRGHLVLHGSAVAIDNQAVVFVGDSGLGKSTLAAYFSSCGHRLLTDDCFQISDVDTIPVTITPNYSGVRLYADSAIQVADSLPRSEVTHYSGKQRIQISSGGEEQTWPLGAIFFLAPGNDESTKAIEATPMRGLERIMRLVQCSFGLFSGTTDELPSQFIKQGLLAKSSMPFFELWYPRQYEKLSYVRQCVLDAMPKRN